MQSYSTYDIYRAALVALVSLVNDLILNGDRENAAPAVQALQHMIEIEIRPDATESTGIGSSERLQ